MPHPQNPEADALEQSLYLQQPTPEELQAAGLPQPEMALDSEAAHHLAEVALREAETTALNNQRHGEVATNLFAAAEQVERDEHVTAARHELDAIFVNGGAAEAAERAAKEAIGMSSFSQSQSIDRVAHDLATGTSPLKEVKQEVSGNVHNNAETADQLATLHDEVNGKAPQLLSSVSEKIKAELRTAGIQEHVSDLNDRVAEVAGAEVTSKAEAVKAEQTIAGDDIAHALADNHPRLKHANRERIINGFKKSGQLHNLGDVVARLRRGDHVSERSLRRIGKTFQRINRHGDKAA